MNEKLINLADACVDVMKTAGDLKEAKKLFRQYLQLAHDMGAGKNQDPSVGRPAVQAAAPAKATAPTPAPTPAKEPAKEPTKESPKEKPTGKVGADKDFK